MTDKDEALVEELAKAIYPVLSDFGYSTRLTVARTFLPFIERERQSAVNEAVSRILVGLRKLDSEHGTNAADAIERGDMGEGASA